MKGEKDEKIKTLEAKVKELEEGQKDSAQMYKEIIKSWEEGYLEYASKTDEERSLEREMELRKAFPPGKYKYVKLIEERDGK